MSESTDSDQVPLKKSKKPRLSKKKSTTRASQSSNPHSEYDIFQKHYSRLVEMASSCVSTITDKLFTRKLICGETLGEVVTGRDSDQKNARRVLHKVEHQIKQDPGKLRILMEVFKEEPVFDDVIKDILTEIQLLNQEVGIIQENSFLLTYKAYLKEIYHQDPIARDDKLSIFPCSNFIKLALVNKHKFTYHADGIDAFTKSTLHGGVDEILATKTPLEMDSLVIPGSKFVLVEGPAGIGKSTLCWELCRKWDTLKSLQDFKIVLLLKLRERRIQNATSLHELFYHEDKQICDSIVKYVLSCSGEGVLLIMDGFDEMPIIADSFVMRLIKGECLPRATCLITSRPSVLHLKDTYFPQNYCHVEILGFTDEYKSQFAEETFKTQPEILAHFKKFIFSNPIITSLMYIPVNCAIIAQVYKELPDVSVPKTMTQLYTLLVLVLIRRHLIQTGRWKGESRVPATLNDLPEDIKADLMRVSELAYEGLMKKNVQVMFTDEEVGESFQHLGLLNKAKEMYVTKGAVTYYFFLHLSVQVFLAAWYASQCPDVLAENARLHWGNLKVFDNFLSGLNVKQLHERNSKVDMMFLVSCC